MAAYAKRGLSLLGFSARLRCVTSANCCMCGREWSARSKVVRYVGHGPTMPAGHRNAFLYSAPNRNRWTLCILRWRLVPRLLRFHPAETGPYRALPATFPIARTPARPLQWQPNAGDRFSRSMRFGHAWHVMADDGGRTRQIA